MEHKRLSISDVLKFARHDYLNELQIILMHNDLENYSNAKKAILDITEKMRYDSQLMNLHLPKTEEWLLTFGWLYPAFQKKLVCNITASIETIDDSTLHLTLDNLFHEAVAMLNPLCEYVATFHIEAHSVEWFMKITIEGELPSRKVVAKQSECFILEEVISHHLRTFTIRGQ